MSTPVVSSIYPQFLQSILLAKILSVVLGMEHGAVRDQYILFCVANNLTLPHADQPSKAAGKVPCLYRETKELIPEK